MRNFKKLSLFCCLFVLLPAGSVLAGELSADDQEALRKTQALLQNPNALKEEGNADEKAALAEISKLTKGDPKAEAQIHGLSADIFGDVVKKNNGDSAAIMKSLLEAQANPQKFMESLSPAQKAEIRRIASEIDPKARK